MVNTNYYQLKISYDGHSYYGWQIQPNVKTVQGELNRALEEITKSSVKTIGAGRTDTGVHALGQIVKIECDLEISPEALIKALNSLLPKDIRVLECSLSTKDFLPTSHAKQKTYHYLFSNQKEVNPFALNYLSNISYELDFDLVREACKLFVGTHDFSDFKCTGSEVSSNIREIYKCEITGPHLDTLNGIFPPYYKLEICGNGFLKQMVRLIVGALWNVGRKKTSLQEIELALKTPQDKRLGIVADACGLYKSEVDYSDSH